MTELEADTIAWFRQGGIELVNSILNVEYPLESERNDALPLLEASGRWRVCWHRVGPSAQPAYGIVIEYLGEN